MPLDEHSIAEVNALSAAASAAKHYAATPLQAESTSNLHDAQPKSYLDKALGVAIKNEAWERNVAEAAKTGAIFFGGKVGLATTVALYALDQIKVGDNFGQACMDAGLGITKGVGLRGINQLAAARDFGIAGQTLSLGLGSRGLDTVLNRQSWTDKQTNSFSLDQGRKAILNTALDRDALVADLGAFAAGGVLSGAANRFAENSLRSSPFWRTTLAAGGFGLATGSTAEIKRETDHKEKLDIGKILAAGGQQAAFNAFAAAPAGMQAGSRLRNTYLDQFGVTTVGEKGTYRYVYRADGNLNEVHAGPASVKGLKAAGVRMGEIAQQHQLDLAQTFGVQIAKGGEEISFHIDGGDQTVKARSPRLNELTALNLALTKSQPGQLLLDGKSGVKFNFLADKDAQNFDAAGLYHRGEKSTNIYLQNETFQEKPMTERDTDRQPNEDGSRRNSMEGVITHEIAHNSDQKVLQQDPDLAEKIRENLGWVRFQPGEYYDTHLLKGNDGRLYRKSTKDSSWVSSDAQGNPLNEAGQKAEPGSEYRITKQQMADRAVVPPNSMYFPNPTEMLMEGFLGFRVGGENRAALLRKSPVLYEQVKAQDNRELALHYGTDAQGLSNMVRLPDGTLAKRNAQSLAEIANFEKQKAANPQGPIW